MTVIEKVALQMNSYNTVFIFKEGAFYKVYNEGIFHLQFLDYSVNCRFSKKINDFLLTMVFPEKVLRTLKIKYKINKEVDYFFFSSLDNFYDIEDYKKWKNKVIEEFENVNLNNKDNLADIIKNYPLAMKSPVDVFIWVSELQKTILERE